MQVADGGARRLALALIVAAPARRRRSPRVSVCLYGERAQELAERQREPRTKWFGALLSKA